MKGSCVILQSGGPTCVINSSLYGVIKQAKKEENITNIYGSLNGVSGIINDDLIDLNKEDEKEIELLKNTPSSILGTHRQKLPSDINDEIYASILSVFQKHDIRYVFIIGGNDSMDTTDKLSKYLKLRDYKCNIMGIPKTVDNDLVLTDHTPGYGSALKYTANVFAELEADVSSFKKGKVTIVEVMGRDAGWLAAGSKLACLSGNGPDLIYLPEKVFYMDKFLEDVARIYEKKRHLLVAVSEAIKDENGNYILNANKKDCFGHPQLGGTSRTLELIVQERLKLPTRSIELNLMQRSSMNLASLTDIKEAIKCGETAVKKAILGHSGEMVVMEFKNNKITYTTKDIHLIANKIKTFPVDWIVNDNDISLEYVEYAKRLIGGNYKHPLVNGLPRFAKLKKIKVN